MPDFVIFNQAAGLSEVAVLLNQWLFIARVEVKGQFPRTGSNQLIGYATTEEAASRHIELKDVERSAKIVGVDVARFGDDISVIQ